MQNKKHKITLGYLPTIAIGAFSREKGLQNKVEIKDKLKQWGFTVVDLAGVNEDELLTDVKDVPDVIKKFREKDVDAIFAPHCNFGTEYSVAMVAKEMNVPFLLWGPRDTAPSKKDGRRLTDSLCGILATSKSFVTMGMPFTYIVNSEIESATFERGFRNFVKTAAVVKTFRKLRIGQIGVHPTGFWSMKVNERELQEKFGIHIETIDLLEIGNAVKKMAEGKSAELTQKIKEYKAKAKFSEIVTEQQIRMMAAMHVVFAQWLREKDIDVACFRCWYSLQDALGIMPCFVSGNLIDEGLPIVCEVDVHGAISAAMARAATMWQESIFFPDLTARHPENDNAILLWHCGPFPPSLCRKGDEVKVGRHSVLERLDVSGCGHFELKHGNITTTRFDGMNGNYSLFIGQGKACEGPMTQGTYVWMEVEDWAKWEERLVHGPYVHHCAAIHDHIAPVLYEACRYIPGLKADPFEPDAEQIEKWLRTGE